MLRGVKDAEGRPYVGEEYQQTAFQHQAEAKLAQDERAWAETVDRFTAGKLQQNRPVRVMTTPIALKLAADEEVGFKEIVTSPAVLKKILEEKHVEVTPDILKQLPRAMADPILVFKSATVSGSYVSMLELKDSAGGTIIVPVALNASKPGKQAFMTSVYSKGNIAQVNNQWFAKQIESGNLRYMNTKKSASWARDVGLQLPIMSLPAEALHELNIPTEADLVKARVENPGFYQDAGTPLGSTRFGEAETIVTILKNGNRSTFLHELGHVFLNSRKNLALMEGIDETVRQDWTTLVEWLEVADIDFSKTLSEADEKRWTNAHEKFAAGFEKYLMEGRAPSLDLARAFRAFRKWLTDIYRAARNIFYVDADGNRVEFEINDEIRGVMDRMLASEDEIEESRAVREAERLAHILTGQGIPDEVVERYRDAVAAGADAARAKLYKKLTTELKAEKQAELQEARKQAKKQAGAEVWDLPEYRALKALLTPRDKGGLRLSMPELIALYGDAGAEALARELPVGVTANDGLSPAEAAELLGYSAPEALLEDLKRAKNLPPQKAVADRVKAATAQLESLIHDPEALRAEAERILHGRERLEWLALETEMLDEVARRLGRKIGEDARREGRERERQRDRDQNRRAEEDLRGVFGPQNLAAMAQAAEAEAKRILAGKRMRDISVSHYMAAEKRASAKALQAAAAARFEEARQWKRTELIHHVLAIEAMNVREEYDKGRKLLERYWPNRKRLRGAIGSETFNQIIGLLERLGVNPEDPAAKNRPRLDEYLNDLAKKRETTPPVARWLRDLDIRDARVSLANLNPEQFEDVTKAVTALDRIGRADWKAFLHNEQESVKALYEDQTHRPGTRKGHTKERVERVAGRQLLLSLDVIAEHTANVVHDLTHRETVRDLYKLIHDDTVRGLLTHAVGRAGFEQFSPWIQSLAAPSVPTDKPDRVFSKMMGNAAAVQLGLNMISAVGQTVSLVPAAWKLGLRRVVPAVLNTLTLRGFWDTEYRDFAFALSPELADRINGTDRDVRVALGVERSTLKKRVLSGANAALYVAIGWVDMAVSLPIWHAAYEKGMARWNDQRKAVDYANYVVRTTNNAEAVKDLAQVQRGGPTRRLFTTYYSAFGSLYQMFREQMTWAGREGIPGKVKLAAFCFMMFTVQSALEDLVKGRAPLGDDEDDNSTGKWLIQGTFSTFSSMFPLVREIPSASTVLGGTGNFRPSPALEAVSAFGKAIDSGFRFVADIWDGEDAGADRVVRDMVMAGGYAFGLPSVQLLRWYKTFVRWANDEPDWSPWELIWHKRGR